MTMIAYFEYRGVSYRVSGPKSPKDLRGFIVSREDGREIRGAKMHPGMVQTGLPNRLWVLAGLALEAKREALIDAALAHDGGDHG